MKNRLLSCGLSLILLLGLLAPAISEICCSEACSGGACDSIDAEVVCDLDASECCSGEPAAVPTPVYTIVGPLALTSECSPCPCFDDDDILGFVVPQKSRELAQNPPTATFSDFISGLPSFSVEKTTHPALEGSPTHGPPIYLSGHSLLI